MLSGKSVHKIQFQIKDETKTARIEATEAYTQYTDEPKTSDEGSALIWNLDKYLETRDRRQDTLNNLMSNRYPALIFLTLNIPGAMKALPGAFGLYKWGFDELHTAFSDIRILIQGSDLLGPYTFFRLDADPVEVKKLCVITETAEPFARLVDLDVYDSDGRQVDRNILGLPTRSCLVCQQPAVECIRLKRHTYDEVIARTHELLTPFKY